MLAWFGLLSAFRHLRDVYRPPVPDAGNAETSSAIQNFGNLGGAAAITLLMCRRMDRPDPPR